MADKRLPRTGIEGGDKIMEWVFWFLGGVMAGLFAGYCLCIWFIIAPLYVLIEQRRKHNGVFY